MLLLQQSRSWVVVTVVVVVVVVDVVLGWMFVLGLNFRVIVCRGFVFICVCVGVNYQSERFEHSNGSVNSTTNK